MWRWRVGNGVSCRCLGEARLEHFVSGYSLAVTSHFQIVLLVRATFWATGVDPRRG